MASVPKASATVSGTWLGSMIPPEPIRIESLRLRLTATPKPHRKHTHPAANRPTSAPMSRQGTL